jgi:hypothetical protein
MASLVFVEAAVSIRILFYGLVHWARPQAMESCSAAALPPNGLKFSNERLSPVTVIICARCTRIHFFAIPPRNLEMNEAIGGYPELELPAPKPFLHDDGALLNSARNAFRLVLEVLKPKRVYIPAYQCSSMRQPLEQTGTPFITYGVNQRLEPATTLQPLMDEIAVIVNYFGLNYNLDIAADSAPGGQFLIDNAQAYFARPPKDAFAIYSPRKFFGVPDGGVLHGFGKSSMPSLPQGISLGRVSHLLGRIDCNPELFYNDFRASSANLAQEAPLAMSKLTRRLLSSINYSEVAEQRRDNFAFLHDQLSSTNGLQVTLRDRAVPLVYPYLATRSGLREHLISHKVYVAKYWPETVANLRDDSFESSLLSNLAPLPIDHRYGCSEMQIVARLVQSWLEHC